MGTTQILPHGMTRSLGKCRPSVIHLDYIYIYVDGKFRSMPSKVKTGSNPNGDSTNKISGKKAKWALKP